MAVGLLLEARVAGRGAARSRGSSTSTSAACSRCCLIAPPSCAP